MITPLTGVAAIAVRCGRTPPSEDEGIGPELAERPERASSGLPPGCREAGDKIDHRSAAGPVGALGGAVGQLRLGQLDQVAQPRGCAPPRRGRSARRATPPPATPASRPWPRWCRARSGRARTNLFWMNLRICTSCTGPGASCTCPERTAGCPTTSIDSTSRRVTCGEAATRASASRSRRTAGRAGRRPVGADQLDRGGEDVVVWPPSRPCGAAAAQRLDRAAGAAQIGVGPQRCRPSTRRRRRPAAARRPVYVFEVVDGVRECRPPCPSPRPRPSAASRRPAPRTAPAPRSGRRPRSCTRRTSSTRRPDRPAAWPPRAAADP